MSSAIQLYSFPAQIGRRGTTAVVVVGLHIVMALGIIAGMTLRSPVPPPPTWIPTAKLPAVQTPPRPQRAPDPTDLSHTKRIAIDTPEDPPVVRRETDPIVIRDPPIVGSRDEPPAATVSDVRVLRHEELRYTAAEIRAGEHGSVVVRVHVGVDGRPDQVEIVTGSGYARLDATALDSVRRWLFAPAQTAVGPIASWATLRVTFRLVD